MSLDTLWTISAIRVEIESAILTGSKISDNLKMTSSMTGEKITTKRIYIQRCSFSEAGTSSVSSIGRVKNARSIVMLNELINPIIRTDSK